MAESSSVQWRFILDEDISPSISRALHDAGFHATSVRDRGLLQGYDWDLLELAYDEDLVVCTKNPKDYEDAAADWHKDGRLHCGVLGVEEWTVEEMAEAIIQYARTHSPNDLADRVVRLPRADAEPR